MLTTLASGEFAFVALGIAERSGLIDRALCKLLLTTVALSMAATPMLAELGGYISNRIEQEKGALASEPILMRSNSSSNFSLTFHILHYKSVTGLTHYLGQDKDAEEMKSESKDFVFVAGIWQLPISRVLPCPMWCDMI